jgi:predicted AAA+ superfamily ATPase
MCAYLPRVADRELAAQLQVMGAVLIEGPKACGKTATASQVARTVVRFDEDDAARSLLSLDPGALFAGETPILFDEWQLEPSIWNRVRRQVDDYGRQGEYILTGSAVPRDNAARHSGAGRISVMQMRPMSLYETGHSSGDVSLAAIMRGERQVGSGTDLSFNELLQRIVIGGWPPLIGRDEGFARSWLTAYLQQIVEVDVPSLGHRRSPGNLARLLAALARNVGQPVKLTELARDVGGEAGPVASETMSGYMDALDRLKLRDDSQAWRPHMRSRTRLRTAAVRYFVDPSLATAALDIGSAELRADPPAAGFHFEALAMRDLRIFAQLLHGTVSSWRDSNGNEVDAIVTLRDGSWAAFEIKLNPRDVDAAAESLRRFAAKIDPGVHGEPAALAVITSTGHAGMRPDGVSVIPIATIGP